MVIKTLMLIYDDILSFAVYNKLCVIYFVFGAPGCHPLMTHLCLSYNRQLATEPIDRRPTNGVAPPRGGMQTMCAI